MDLQCEQWRGKKKKKNATMGGIFRNLFPDSLPLSLVVLFKAMIIFLMRQNIGAANELVKT